MKLYKYVHPDRITFLFDGRIRFTQAADFNDPFEIVPYFAALLPSGQEDTYLSTLRPDADSIVEDEVAQQISKLPREMRSLARTWLRQQITGEGVIAEMKKLMPIAVAANKGSFGRHFQEQFGERFGILSLAEDPMKLLMWAHYGDCHRGFVIEFDTTDPFFRPSVVRGAIGKLMKVVYSQARPALVAYDPTVPVEQFAERLVRDLLLTKGLEWSYEGEWRMILPLDDRSKFSHRIDGRLHLFAVPPSAVSAVILGARASETTKTSVRNALAVSHFRHVALRQLKTSDTEFAVTE